MICKEIMANNNYIGIDLSTRDIGYFFLKEGTKYYWNGVMQLERFCPENLNSNKAKLTEFVEKIKKFSGGYPVKIGIELSNFGNPQITNWFHYYAGFLTGLIFEKIEDVEFKYFNANEWFNHFLEDYNKVHDTEYITNKLESDFRKKIVFDCCVETMKINGIKFNLFNANMTDAWAIANYYDKCKNTITGIFENRQVKKAAKEKKVSKKQQIIKLKEKAIKIKDELIKYNDESKKYSVPQLKKKLRLQNELSELEQKISELK